MDAFHYQDVVLVQLHHITLEEGFALLEIIARQFHFSAVQKGVQMPSQQLQVHGFQGLEIVLSVFVQGRTFAGNKVIVQFNHLGIHAQHFELLGQPEGRGGFSAGGRSGNEDNLHPFALCVNLVGQICIGPFLPGFAEVDQFHGLSVHQTLVQGPHAHDSGGLAPLSVLLERNGEFLLFQAGNHSGDVFQPGIL